MRPIGSTAVSISTQAIRRKGQSHGEKLTVIFLKWPPLSAPWAKSSISGFSRAKEAEFSPLDLFFE